MLSSFMAIPKGMGQAEEVGVVQPDVVGVWAIYFNVLQQLMILLALDLASHGLLPLMNNGSALKAKQTHNDCVHL